MKESIFEKVLIGVEEEVNKIADTISADFKKVKPFDSVNPDSLVKYYLQLTPMEKAGFVNHYGESALEFFADLEKRARRV